MITLERVRWWHLPAIIRLEREVFREDPWSEELFWTELAQRDLRHYLVAVDAGSVDGEAIAGYAGLATDGPAPDADQAFVQTLAVAAPYRRTGLGARLMVALLREARRRGAGSVGLEVRTDNDPARALYDRLGFRTVGLRRGYYQPSGADAYVMIAEGLDTPAFDAVLAAG